MIANSNIRELQFLIMGQIKKRFSDILDYIKKAIFVKDVI